MIDNLCECGCGEQTTWQQKRKAFARFVTGHNTRGQRKPRVSIPCRQCGKPWEGTEKAAKGRAGFCSKECHNEFLRVGTGEAHPAYASVEFPCATCGEPVMKSPSQMANGRRAYCSVECGKAGWKANQPEVRNRKAGIGLDTTRKVAKSRDGFRCRACGFALALHVHHIVPRHQGGKHASDNLITLCPNHHAMAHAGLLSASDLMDLLAKPLSYDPLEEAQSNIMFRSLISTSP